MTLSVENPYPYYDGIRANPVHWDDLLKCWTLTSYAHIAEALTHPGLSSRRPEPNLDSLSPEAKQQAREVCDTLAEWLLRLDAPAHTRLRALANQALTRQCLDGLRDPLRKTAESLIDARQSSGYMEVITEFARPLALSAIGALLGLPPVHQPKFERWADAVGAAAEGAPEAARMVRARQSLTYARQYLVDLLSACPVTLEGGMLARLRGAEYKGGHINLREIVGITTLFLLAGRDTACHSLANGLLALLQDPDQLELLTKDPSLIDRAASEVIRYDSPLQGVMRVAVRDLELGGKQIKRGQTVVLWLAAANRDPALFADANRLIVKRKAGSHLAFGHGIHYCLGSSLGTLVVATGLESLIGRSDRLGLANPVVEWQGNFLFRSQRSLMIRL
jgi:cytochrome P450